MVYLLVYFWVSFAFFNCVFKSANEMFPFCWTWCTTQRITKKGMFKEEKCIQDKCRDGERESWKEQKRWKTSALFPMRLRIQIRIMKEFLLNRAYIFVRDYDENKEDSRKSEDIFFLFFHVLITTILRQISKNSKIFHTKGIEIASCMRHTQTNYCCCCSFFSLPESFILMKCFIGECRCGCCCCYCCLILVFRIVE